MAVKSKWTVSCVILIMALFEFRSASSKTRKYYIAAVERDWNYAPTGLNVVKGIQLEQDRDAAQYTESGPQRIGKIYRKVLYREFTDETFTKEIPHPQHLGVLGPVIKGEVGDTIKVHFKNMANRPYTMHPHGVFYDKGSEGALYDDHTKGDLKGDDHVQPNMSRVYDWSIPDNHAPTEDDENCLMWAYHSHLSPQEDINTGLIGAILTCKKGTLDPLSGIRADVDKEFILLFTVFDENKSWLLDENIKRFCSDPDGAMKLKTDGAFVKSNKMSSINGRVFGNLEGLETCLGDKVAWHIYGIGTDSDVHSAYFHGQIFTIDHHRQSIAIALPATFLTGNMNTVNAGTWLLNCMVTGGYDGGMYTVFKVNKFARNATTSMPSGGTIRRYFIAAEEKLWNYAPSGLNKITGESLTQPGSESSKYFIQADDRIGGTYKKALYFEYTDESFSILKNRTEDQLHLGYLGPVIRGAVGDTIQVVFKNMASRNYSIHPIGVLFNKSNEGALYQDGTYGDEKTDDAIPPGGNYTYHWTVPEEMGPRPTDPQCLTSMYLSFVDPTKDRYAGLFGPLLICKKGSLDSHNKQKNFEREFILYFSVTLEKVSWYYDFNKQQAKNASIINEADAAYISSNKMHDINGYVYGNLPGLSMCRGDRVSWHIMSGILMHSASFYGNTVIFNGKRTDVIGLVQGSLHTVYMTPDNPGIWKVLCQTTSHATGGMETTYTVRENCGRSISAQASDTIRRYFIAAVEETWDYAPSGRDILEGKALEDSEDAKRYTEQGSNRIGRQYKKAVFREFTDYTFSVKKERKTDYDKHLGILGPIIRAEVGDTIEVWFKNMASRDYSMHPHGVFYDKEDEGSNYRDGTTGAYLADNAIHPGKTYNYVWQVPERAGPTSNDGNCLVWSYYSDSYPVIDFYSGLVGPLVVCKEGTLKGNNSRRDVDREFFLLFATFDENRSWYLNENINKYCSNPGPLNRLKNDAGFKESNQNYAINGFLYGNLPGLKMYSGEKVVWYLMGLGDLTDVHTVHFHGQTFIYKSSTLHRKDVYDLFPGVYAAVEMIPDSTGKWLLHCHVNNHMSGGMQTLFTVMAPTEKPKPTVKAESGAPDSKISHMVAAGCFALLVVWSMYFTDL
ncbi:hephaestin-like protein [Montipora capricornis]|uniref:hephaestin-like protein n=1 Tax=Montipora capricornis TaxID=246305 RepID=UPI0035F162CF